MGEIHVHGEPPYRDDTRRARYRLQINGTNIDDQLATISPQRPNGLDAAHRHSADLHATPRNVGRPVARYRATSGGLSRDATHCWTTCRATPRIIGRRQKPSTHFPARFATNCTIERVPLPEKLAQPRVLLLRDRFGHRKSRSIVRFVAQSARDPGRGRSNARPPCRSSLPARRSAERFPAATFPRAHQSGNRLRIMNNLLAFSEIWPLSAPAL